MTEIYFSDETTTWSVYYYRCDIFTPPYTCFRTHYQNSLKEAQTYKCFGDKILIYIFITTICVEIN